MGGRGGGRGMGGERACLLIRLRWMGSARWRWVRRGSGVGMGVRDMLVDFVGWRC